MSSSKHKHVDDLCLQDLFLEQVEKTPDAIAVVDGDIELTYRQLDDVSSQLAIQLLEDYSVGPDQVVGILMKRSVQYVIAYCAVLKAGGAYMPLEVVYPRALLERAITETNTQVTLTTNEFVNRIENLPHIVLGEDMPFLEYSTSLSYPPASYVAPKADHLAFCVMSSGTTGKPKGICQTHRAAIHSYVDRLTRFPYFQDENGVVSDRVGAGVFFVWELFRPLLRGATCVVIPDHVLLDPHAVTNFVLDYQVTRILFTPSLLQLILDTIPGDVLQQRLNGLRYLWLCGEVVSTGLAQKFTALFPNVELMNLYSISECHDVSIGDLKRDLDPDRKYATCGTNIPGVTFYIVDMETTHTPTEMKLVEAGQTGEVFVGGPVVGRGYLNMPDKTAERFVANPWDADQYTQTLYRTGDMGRILTNGPLEILGRCDFMVKIRGYSVVLPSIESALSKHPQISSSVVLAVGQETTDKKLVAYIVPIDLTSPPTANSVRQFLKDQLPPYAIPSIFCVIPKLPVDHTAAGKLDRKKLPDPERATKLPVGRCLEEDTAGLSSSAPLNETEQSLLELWKELLDVESLSCTDNFFDVGGHSLLATRLVTRVQEMMGSDVTIAHVLQGPTIRQLAQCILTQSASPQNATEETLLELWKELLAVESLSCTDNFFDVGGHSLLSTRLVSKINEQNLGRNMTITQLFENPTIRGTAQLVTPNSCNNDSPTTKRINLQAEAEALDPSIQVSSVTPTQSFTKPRAVFLTGATGYLGVHLLADLLLQKDVKVMALARASSGPAAKERILSTLKKHGFPNLATNMLVAVAGDLEKPSFGLSREKFNKLAQATDCILHCGAQVNLLKSYESLKKANVGGTQEILRLATSWRVKPVYYISTNGIFPVTKEAYPVSQDVVVVKEDVDLPTLERHVHGEGYAMTKWVAEQMCHIAGNRGVPVTVMRPGNMAGDSSTGIQNPDDLHYLLIQGMLETKSAPVLGTGYAMDMTPVDYAAKAAVHLVLKGKSAHGPFHLQSPQDPVSLEKVLELLQEIGHGPFEAVTRDEWMKRIAAASGCQKLSSGWLSFEKYFSAYAWLQLDQSNLGKALPPSMKCTPLDATMLKKWFPVN